MSNTSGVRGEGEQVGPFLERHQFGELIQYVFYCPGCQGCHAYTIARAAGDQGPIWTFNRNPEKPTFRASLLNWRDDRRCHLHVTDGQIEYCSDCTHELAGKTIPMETYP